MIDPEEFADIIKELERRPIENNKYRKKSGEGRSQTFGVVNRRCLAPDYSRQNWLRPYLYKLLLDFGKKHVSIPFNAITVNQNYRASAHRDRGNIGESYLVAFGKYSEGELEIQEGPLKGLHNVKCTPLITDFSKVLHEVKSFTGNRYSLVYYQLSINKKFKNNVIPPCSVEMIDGVWKFKRGDEVCEGLPHPLRKHEIYVEKKNIIISFD
jgi:hypothetical protein